MIKIFKKGRKRKFLIYGFFNFLITIIFLQLFLFLFPVGISTSLSQIINFSLGYIIYGKKVFKVEKLRKQSASKYFLLAIFLWITNWYGINIINIFIESRNISALIMVPMQVLISYSGQRFFVFKKDLN